jgi:hypothetical protein
LGLLTNLDKAVFSSYCQAWSIWIEAISKFRQGGLLVKNREIFGDDVPRINPYLPTEDLDAISKNVTGIDRFDTVRQKTAAYETTGDGGGACRTCASRATS